MPIDVSRLPNSSISGRETASTSRSSEVSHVSVSGSNSGSVNYNSLSKGQVFSGQITNISPGELTLELDNGQTMTAKYDNNSELSIGDGARFKVVDREDGQITIKPLQTGSTIENVVYKALDASGLPFSPKNEELITALLKNEYPVSKQMINGMLQQSLKNPDISMTNLVLMNKAGLDINPESTKIFEMYSSGRTELAAATEQNFNDMLDMINGLLSDGDIDGSTDLAGKFLDIFNIGKEPDELVLTLALNDETPSPSMPPMNFSNFLESLVAEEISLPDNFITGADGQPQNAVLAEDTPISFILNDEQRLEIFTLFETADTEVDAAKLQNLIKGSMGVSDLTELLKTLPDAEQAKLTPMMKQAAEVLGREFTMPSEALKELLPESASLSDAATHIQKLLADNNLSPEIKQALLKSDDFHKTLKMLIHTDWTLSAEELTEKDAVVSLYKRMDEQIDKLKSLADSTPGSAANKLSTDLGQTKQNMNFMNDMNHMYNFVELPIRMTGQTVTGDLYVYSDKHRKRTSNGDGISCLLHLDMENLGGMNIRIELSDGQVSTRFFLNDEDSGRLIAKHLPELDTAMSKQGFNPKSEVVKTSDKEEEKKLLSGKFNPINDFLPSETISNNFSRYTFDVRA